MGIKVQFVDEVPAVNYDKPRGPKPGTVSKFVKPIKMLKANPGKWALVQKVQKRSRLTYAAQVFRKNGIQVSIRKTGGNWYHLYARYIPPTGE